jgi:hypothetical protein
MYFIVSTSCLRDHRSLPCDAIQKFGWLLRGAISRSFDAINHRRHRFLQYDVARYAGCCHPRDQQRTKCLIVASSRLAMVRLLSSHASSSKTTLQHQGYNRRRFSRDTTYEYARHRRRF